MFTLGGGGVILWKGLMMGFFCLWFFMDREVIYGVWRNEEPGFWLVDQY